MSTRTAQNSATVIILAWNAWESTRRCLESLRPTLRPGDQVVIVDNGSTDGTGKALESYNWVEVISNPINAGFAPGCNQGATAARGDVLIFLNNDTIVYKGWLEELVSPFSDPRVGAAGPRSNNVSGEQAVPSAPNRSSAELTQFANSWMNSHFQRFTECGRLVGFCLAVRADSFREVEGFDEEYKVGGFEDDDLCMKLRSRGLHLVIAQGSFIHHDAHVSFDANGVDWLAQQEHNQSRFRQKWGRGTIEPLCLLSVCMIVKDEEHVLQACLDSVKAVADEIVVYDTGSSDRTVEIARAAGARVIEGYWDHSFARARNAALAEAKGTWVLSLDADETLLGDPKPLRDVVADWSSQIEAYVLSIENLQGLGKSRFVHSAVRLFRRENCNWKYRLHEQVAPADDPARALNMGFMAGVRLIHYGYVAEVMGGKKKAERNLRIAEEAVNDEGLNKSYSLLNYGRALYSAGKTEKSAEMLREAVEISNNPTTKRFALFNLIYVLMESRLFDEVLDRIGELRECSGSQITADIAEARLMIARGDIEDGLALLARVPEKSRDDDGMEYAAHMLAAIRGEALANLGRFGDAADVVLDAIRREGVLEVDLSEITFWLLKSGRSLAEIAEAMSVDDLMPMLGLVVRQPSAVADVILEGIWGRFPDRLEPLAAASQLGPILPVARALVWSSRLRGRGLASACPLVKIVNNPSVEPRVRVLAGAAAFGSFGDRSVVKGVKEARDLLEGHELEESTAEVGRIAPGLFEASYEEPGTKEVPESELTAPASGHGIHSRGRRISLRNAPPRVAETVSRGVNIVGPFEEATIYGEISRNLASLFSARGRKLSTISYSSGNNGGSVEWTHIGSNDYPFDKTLMVLSPEDMGNYMLDYGATPFSARYVMALWPWDMPKPSRMASTVAQAVQEIWVPSSFASQAISQATDRTVRRVPLPVVFSKSHEIWSSENDATCTTFVASVDFQRGFERQNPLGAVAAFKLAFEQCEGPELVIEVAHSTSYPFEFRRLREAIEDRGDISVVETNESLLNPSSSKLRDLGCFVSLHRSEGTGLEIARAMSLGIPTIVTGHSFSADYQSHADGFIIPCQLVPVDESSSGYFPGGEWADPIVEEAAKAMRVVVEQPRLAMAKARKAREAARRQFSPGRVFQAISTRLSEIDSWRYGRVPSASRQVSFPDRQKIDYRSQLLKSMDRS